MAYSRSLKVQCAKCSKTATVEVINNRNATYGKYCTEHGKSALKYLKELEDREHKVWERNV